MKLKLVKNVTMKGAPAVIILAGSIVETTPETGVTWISAGYAQPLNTIETAEKAVLPPAENRANVETTAAVEKVAASNKSKRKNG